MADAPDSGSRKPSHDSPQPAKIDSDRDARSPEIARLGQSWGTQRGGRDDLARIARRVRLLIPSTTGDVRAELEEIRVELDAMVGPVADVVPLDTAARRRR